MRADDSSQAVLLDLPADVILALRRIRGDSPGSVDDSGARELRLAAALHLYERGDVTLEEGAGLAGLDPDIFRRAVRVDAPDTFEVDLGAD